MEQAGLLFLSRADGAEQSLGVTVEVKIPWGGVTGLQIIGASKFQEISQENKRDKSIYYVKLTQHLHCILPSVHVLFIHLFIIHLVCIF